MPSFQSVILHKLISLYRREYHTSIERLRMDRAKISRYMPLPFATELKTVDANGVAAEWITPSGISSHHVILYLHGGAFVTDMELRGESFRTRAAADPMLTRRWLKPLLDSYVGKHDPRMPLLSPIHADLHGLPPMQILVGSNEILLSDSTVLARHARSAGVRVTLEVGEGMWHCWPLVPALPEARRALKKIAAFARQHFK